MAVDVNLETISSGFNISKINTNFQRIDNALQDVVSRSGTNPNSMNADFDMNGNDILNVDNIDVNVLTFDGIPFVPGDGIVVDPERLLPDGGTDGQVLTKQSTSNYDVEWEDVPDAANITNVDSRTALKALDTTIYQAAILNDSGRSGTFVWRTGNFSAQITNDTQEGIYIKADAIAASVGAWIRQFEGAPSVKFWGALGDNTNDDAAAINAAVQFLAPSTVGFGTSLLRAPMLVFPAGTYRITDEIAVNNSIIFRGAGAGAATINADVSGSTHSAGIYLGDSSYLSNNEGYYAFDMENIVVNVVSGNFALRNQGLRTMRLRRNTFRGGALQTVRVEQAWSTSIIEDNNFIGTGVAGQIGLLLSDRDNSFTVQNNYFAGYSSSTGVAFEGKDSAGLRLVHNDFEYNYNQILIWAADQNTNNVYIESNWIEGATGYSIKLDNTTLGFSGVTIINNSIYGTPDGSVYLGVAGGAGAILGYVVQGNTFNSPSVFLMPSSPEKYSRGQANANYPAAQNPGLTSLVETTFASADFFSGGVTIKKRGTTGDGGAAIGNGSEIGYHTFSAWDGSVYGRGAYVIVQSTQAWTGSARGTSYEIFTTPNGSTTNTKALTINQDQSVKASSPTGGLGYDTGAGGTVTQSTSKSTGVTLNKVTGQITMNNAALPAATIVSFTLTNSAIAATDILVLNHVSGGTLGAYTLNAACAAGSATITIRNNTAGSLSEALVLGFALIKGATA